MYADYNQKKSGTSISNNWIYMGVYTVAMRPLLGCENGSHQFNGTQAKGLMNINGKGTRLSVASIAVDRMRGGDKAEVPVGYLNFYTETNTQNCVPDRYFKCLFEFLVDGKLVYATICNEQHSRGADLKV